MMTLKRHQSLNPLLLLAISGTLACSDSAGGGPSPTRYDWPERFAFKVDFVSSTQRAGRELLRYSESRVLRFGVRDDESYLVIPDSVIKASGEPDRPMTMRRARAAGAGRW